MLVKCMETVTISKKEYDELRRKSEVVDKLTEGDVDFVRQILRSKEDLKHGRFKVLA